MSKKTTPSREGTPDPSETQRLWRRHRRLVHAGQALLGLGALVVISHWLAHLDVLGIGQPPGWLDLAAGYPMGALLLMACAIMAGRRRPGSGTRT